MWLKTGEMIFFVLMFVLSAGAVPNGNKLTASDSTEFAREKFKRAASPDGKAAILLRQAVNEDVDPTMEAQAGKRKIALGDLRRSARVFWRPDSRVAILWDTAYSNHDFVRLIRVKPTLAEIPQFDELIKKKVRKAFRAMQSGEIFHYWPHVMGWTEDKQLLVVVDADATASKNPLETRVVGLCHGYVIDTDRVAIRSQLNEAEVVKAIGSAPNPCE